MYILVYVYISIRIYVYIDIRIYLYMHIPALLWQNFILFNGLTVSNFKYY